MPRHLPGPFGKSQTPNYGVCGSPATLREHLLASTGFSIVSLLHWTALALAVFKEQGSADRCSCGPRLSSSTKACRPQTRRSALPAVLPAACSHPRTPI
jgi:hypothetical protein